MKTKLLFVNGHLNITGVEKSLIELLNNLNYTELEVDLVLFEDIGDYAEEVPKEVNILFYDLTKTYGPFKQCIINRIKKRDWFSLCLRLVFLFSGKISLHFLSLSKPLFKLNKSYDCAIAYRVGFCTDFVGYVIKSNKKVTWWHHGEYNLSEKQTKRLNQVYKKFDSIVVVSDGCRKMLTEQIPEIEKKLITINNIVDKDLIRKKSNDYSAYQNDFHAQKILISVGRLSPEKNMINCVYVCKKLIENNYNILWLIIGDGEQRKCIEELIMNYELERYVFLLGTVKNPYPYIKNAYIYVHPSTVESFSLSILEALTLNKPVVAANSVGPMEFIKNEKNGLLVEGTPEGLYDGIVRLMENEALYDQLKKGNNEALEKYSPSIVIESINRLLY